ncbi:MAG: methyltransferase domain-containing protein [Thermoanaerobaculia bacterium]
MSFRSTIRDPRYSATLSAMKATTFEILRCPACAAPLTSVAAESEDASLKCTGCEVSYAMRNGIPRLVHPPEAAPADDEDAVSYDELIRWLSDLLGGDERATRDALVHKLELEPGDRVLEIACGTGSNFPDLARGIGPNGEIVGLDLSESMIEQASLKGAQIDCSIDLVTANALHLPFADRSFDAVLHIGTINRFGDVPRALREMARVAKEGAKVVVCDEGVAPWLLAHEHGRDLRKISELFAYQPPIGALPAVAQEVALSWVLGNAFYVFDFRVGVPPVLRRDLKMFGWSGSVADFLARRGSRTDSER